MILKLVFYQTFFVNEKIIDIYLLVLIESRTLNHVFVFTILS